MDKTAKGDGTAAKRRRVKREDCKEYLQNQVAEVLQDAMDKAKRKVLRGDLNTLKALWQMGGLDKQVPRARKRRGGLGAQLLKRLKERAEC